MGFGVVEIEEDLVGGEGGAAGGDAAEGAEALVVGVPGGAGFEVGEDEGEGVGGRGEVEVVGAGGVEPVAEGVRADGEDLVATGGGDGNPEEGLALVGREGEAGFEDGKE